MQKMDLEPYLDGSTYIAKDGEDFPEGQITEFRRMLRREARKHGLKVRLKALGPNLRFTAYVPVEEDEEDFG